MTKSMMCLALAAGLARAASAQEQRFADLGACKLESGATIEECRIGYRTIGALDAKRSNVVVFPTWHTGTSADALTFITPESMFDPTGWYVVVIDSPGDGVSSSPSNSRTQHGVAFPRFTIRDMVEIERRLLTEKLKLDHVHAVIGFSLGGSQTFQWIASHPQYMDVAVPVSGTPKQTSYDLLFWRTYEQAMLADPEYRNGAYAKNPPLPLLQHIFALNQMTPSYRVAHTEPAAFEKFFADSAADDPASPDANDSRWQVDAMLAQDIGTPKTLPTRVHVIVAAQDHLVNPAPAQEFARTWKTGLTILDGDCGHIAALRCDAATAREALRAALSATSR